MPKTIICPNCRNYLDNFTCLAFPQGIPDDILEGWDDHTTPRPEQTLPYVFEPMT